MRSAIMLSLGVALLTATSNPADDKVPKEAPKLSNRAGDRGDYLTKDGKLKETLTFRIGTVGLVPPGGPKGEVWVIEPTGEWTSQVAKAKGKFSAKQLVALAQHLATQDFSSLPETQGYKQQYIDEFLSCVVIGFGKKQAIFYTKLGEARIDALPKPDDPQAGAWSRFVALELILTDMLRTSEIKGKASVGAKKPLRQNPDMASVGLSKGMTRAQANEALKAGGFQAWTDASVSDQWERFRKPWHGGYHYVNLRFSGAVIAEVGEFWIDP